MSRVYLSLCRIESELVASTGSLVILSRFSRVLPRHRPVNFSLQLYCVNMPRLRTHAYVSCSASRLDCCPRPWDSSPAQVASDSPVPVRYRHQSAGKGSSSGPSVAAPGTVGQHSSSVRSWGACGVRHGTRTPSKRGFRTGSGGLPAKGFASLLHGSLPCTLERAARDLAGLSHCPLPCCVWRKPRFVLVRYFASTKVPHLADEAVASTLSCTNSERLLLNFQ